MLKGKIIKVKELTEKQKVEMFDLMDYYNGLDFMGVSALPITYERLIGIFDAERYEEIEKSTDEKDDAKYRKLNHSSG